MNNNIMNLDWLRAARRKLEQFHQMAREELYSHEIYPAWITGDDIRFPGDDAEMPRRPPANDAAFTMTFR